MTKLLLPKTDTYQLLIFLLITLPAYVFFSDYLRFVLAITFYYAMVALSWNLIYGYTGLLSFASAAFASIGAYSSALVSNYFSIHPAFTVLLGAATAGFAGAAIGVITLRMSGPYLALTTIAFAEIFRRFLIVESDITRGNLGLPTEAFFPQSLSLPGSYFLGIGLMLAFLIGTSLILNSKIGYFMRSIRDDELGASTLGINVTKYKVISFTISSFMAGLAGGYYAHFVGLITPDTALLTESATIIVTTVIGGVGTLTGPILGAIITYPLGEFLRAYGELRWVIFGFALALIIRFAQRGVYGAISRILRLR